MGQGRFNFRDIFRALDKCAKGWSHEVTTHSVKITFNGEDVYLRKGPGRGLPFPRRVFVNDGEVIDMLERFEIPAECSEKHLPGLRD